MLLQAVAGLEDRRVRHRLVDPDDPPVGAVVEARDRRRSDRRPGAPCARSPAREAAQPVEVEVERVEQTRGRAPRDPVLLDGEPTRAQLADERAQELVTAAGRRRHELVEQRQIRTTTRGYARGRARCRTSEPALSASRKTRAQRDARGRPATHRPECRATAARARARIASTYRVPAESSLDRLPGTAADGGCREPSAMRPSMSAARTSLRHQVRRAGSSRRPRARSPTRSLRSGRPRRDDRSPSPGATPSSPPSSCCPLTGSATTRAPARRSRTSENAIVGLDLDVWWRRRERSRGVGRRRRGGSAIRADARRCAEAGAWSRCGSAPIETTSRSGRAPSGGRKNSVSTPKGTNMTGASVLAASASRITSASCSL